MHKKCILITYGFCKRESTKTLSNCLQKDTNITIYLSSTMLSATLERHFCNKFHPINFLLNLFKQYWYELLSIFTYTCLHTSNPSSVHQHLTTFV